MRSASTDATRPHSAANAIEGRATRISGRQAVRASRAGDIDAIHHAPGVQNSTEVRAERRTQNAERRASEWLFYRRTLRREQLGAVFGDVHVVLETHAELALDVDARLVAEHHPGLQRQRFLPPENVVLHQVGPPVAVHAHAVSEAGG